MTELGPKYHNLPRGLVTKVLAYNKTHATVHVVMVDREVWNSAIDEGLLINFLLGKYHQFNFEVGDILYNTEEKKVWTIMSKKLQLEYRPLMPLITRYPVNYWHPNYLNYVTYDEGEKRSYRQRHIGGLGEHLPIGFLAHKLFLDNNFQIVKNILFLDYQGNKYVTTNCSPKFLAEIEKIALGQTSEKILTIMPYLSDLDDSLTTDGHAIDLAAVQIVRER